MAMIFFDPAIGSGAMWTGQASLAPASLTGTGSTQITGVGTAYGRFTGASGYLLHPNNYVSGGPYLTIAAQSTLFAAGSYKFTVIQTGGYFPFISMMDSGTVQLNFAINSAGNVQIYRGGTLLATSTAVVSLNAWHRFECQGTINSSTGFAECIMDGVSIVSFTGNTQQTTNASANQVMVGSPCYVDTWLTDILIYNNTGAAPTGYLGDKRLYVQYPSADGSATAWTANWASFANNTAYVLQQQFLDGNGNVQRCTTVGTSALSGTPTWSTTLGGTTTSGGATFTCEGAAANYKAVNETTTDGDNSYLSDSTVGDKEGFLFPALSGVTNIVGVGAIAYSRKDDAGTRSICLEVLSGSSTSDSASTAQSTTYQYEQGFFPTDPNTSSGWTQAGVNAAEIRVKTTA